MRVIIVNSQSLFLEIIFFFNFLFFYFCCVPISLPHSLYQTRSYCTYRHLLLSYLQSSFMAIDKRYTDVRPYTSGLATCWLVKRLSVHLNNVQTLFCSSLSFSVVITSVLTGFISHSFCLFFFLVFLTFLLVIEFKKKQKISFFLRKFCYLASVLILAVLWYLSLTSTN